MGGSGGSSILGGSGSGILSGIWGDKGMTNGSGLPPRTPDAYTQFNLGMDAIDAMTMSYEDLQRLGLINPQFAAGYRGLSPGESRFSRSVGNFEKGLAEADPTFAAYQKTVTSGLEGLDSGLPDDARRSITESLRSAQSSRGIDLTSNTAAIAEVTRLFGGEQAIRSQRLAEASNYFNQVTGTAAQMYAPSINNYLQASLGGAALMNERASIGQRKHEADQGVASDVIGAVIGGLAGGGA